MLKNAYFLAKIGADTAENERNFAKNWQLPYPTLPLLRPAGVRLGVVAQLLAPALDGAARGVGAGAVAGVVASP